MSPQCCKAEWCLFVPLAVANTGNSAFFHANYLCILYDSDDRVGRDSSVGTASELWTGMSADRIPVIGEIFRTRPDRLWGPPVRLYNVYRVIPGIKTTGAWR